MEKAFGKNNYTMNKSIAILLVEKSKSLKKYMLNKSCPLFYIGLIVVLHNHAFNFY